MVSRLTHEFRDSFIETYHILYAIIIVVTALVAMESNMVVVNSLNTGKYFAGGAEPAKRLRVKKRLRVNNNPRYPMVVPGSV